MKRRLFKLVVFLMEMVIQLLITHLNRFREDLDDATITLIDQLMESDKQPGELEKGVLYQAERRLRRKLGDEEYLNRT